MVGKPVRPSTHQILRQLGLIALILALWSLLFVGYLRLTKDSPTTTTNTAAGAAPPTAAPTLDSSPESPTPVGESDVSFTKDVLPIFEKRCVKCHGGWRTEARLTLNTFDGLLAGSENGPVIEPGNAAGSLLVQQIISGAMPKREPSLLPAEIQTISDWVDAGALDN